MRLYGSLVNRIEENITPKTPEVGDGVTEYMYSDRHAYTVIEVKSPNLVCVQRDNAIRVDKLGMTDAQVYEFAPDPDGVTFWIRKNKKGLWKQLGHPKGDVFVVGIRSEYYDYSF